MLTLFHNLLRAFQVSRVLLRRVVFPLLLPGSRRIADRPAQLRKAAEELGGTWIKLGQALALRFDLLPAEYCNEFFKLLNQVKPFPYEQARQIVYEDLKRYPEEIFDSFEPEAFAAASIGQVHRAVLHTGEKVAVKVQRPNVRQIINADISTMYTISRILDWTHLLGATRTREVIDEFARWTMDELDYRIEARHACTLHQNARDEATEKNAKIYLEFSGQRVLTMELIEGVPLIEIIYAVREDNVAYLRSFREQGYDLHLVATNLTWNLLNQVYRHGYFHADLHPANLFVLPDNVIGYVDFGIVGQLSPEIRESLAHYAWRLFQGDTDRAVGEFMRWIRPSEKTDVKLARSELTRNVDAYLFSLSILKRDSSKEGTSVFEIELLNTIRRHEMMISPSIVIYLKALVTADALIYELDPGFNLPELENRFFRRVILQAALDFLSPRKVAAFLFDYSHRLRRALDNLESLQRPEHQNSESVRRLRWPVILLLLLSAGLATFSYFVRVSSAGKAVEIQEILLPILLLGFLVLLFLAGIQQSR